MQELPFFRGIRIIVQHEQVGLRPALLQRTLQAVQSGCWISSCRLLWVHQDMGLDHNRVPAGLESRTVGRSCSK